MFCPSRDSPTRMDGCLWVLRETRNTLRDTLIVYGVSNRNTPAPWEPILNLEIRCQNYPWLGSIAKLVAADPKTCGLATFLPCPSPLFVPFGGALNRDQALPRLF